ncbi:mercury methylation corrinoid protein HgcA [Desulfitobacterium sp. Sab5]|uniref:mercury methylation corrinoid protein HgcA n=1 Tax=Desulfitobacterium nosdiversum TaxID=3375356 RepID=UPI003CF5727B
MELLTKREIKITPTSDELTLHDIVGSWKVRWGINRMNYKIDPGLYTVGKPHSKSPVLVSANYKLSFDMLRKELKGIDAWLLVLDTKGVNVWCAAGKGTFGTSELINRIGSTQLLKLVEHKTLILPQLGAPGIKAYEITKYTGFKVIYGPVRASDIRAFLKSGMKAAKEMRTVKFSAYDRLILTPIELVHTFRPSLIIFGFLFLLNIAGIGPFDIIDFYAYAGAVIVGCILTPVLLPWIPGRAFAWKGWLLGVAWIIGVNLINGWPGQLQYSSLRAIAYMLLLPPVSAYLAMNFTGSTTYTSFSGVLKEMRIAIPVMIISLFLGGVLILIESFIR